MGSRRMLRYAALPLVLVAACSRPPEDGELSATRVEAHFQAQAECVAYVDALVAPVAAELSALRRPEDMRAWLAEHRDRDAFTQLVARVQQKTAGHRAIDPRRDADQMAVMSRIPGALEQATGFRASSCGAEVREVLSETLYRRLGGEAAPVAGTLRRRGVEDSGEQKAVLLVSLMAGSLASGPADAGSVGAEPGAGSAADAGRVQLGVAKLRDDGTLEISLSRDLDGNFVEGYFLLRPDDPRYDREMAHLGELVPGREVPYFANEGPAD